MSVETLLAKLVFSLDFFRRPSVAFCAHHGLLPDVFVKQAPALLRRQLFLPASRHESQLNQDVFGLLANQFRRGYFVEIGANDGFTLSNSVYLEECFGWNGLLIEANPAYEESLRRRTARVEIAAVTEREGNYQFSSAGLYGGITSSLDSTHAAMTRGAESISVRGARLETLFQRHDVPARVAFISIDVEGAELSIVQQMCSLESTRFTAGCIEHNARADDYAAIKSLLEQADYRIVWEGQTRHDLFFIDRRMIGDA